MAEDKEAGPGLYFIGAICLFVMAGVFIGLAVQSGEAEVGIFLIFPFVMGGGIMMGIGILFVFLGIIALLVGLMKRFTLVAVDMMDDDEGHRPVRKGKKRPRTVGDQEVRPARTLGGTKGGGVVFVGPIPIVFGSDTKVTKLMLYLAIVAVIAMCLLFFALTLR
jgi:uncharacterized protein (TIGR00304 family)